MSEPGERRVAGRTIALVVLLILNVVLIVLNLQKQELFPFEPAETSAEAIN